MQVRQAVDRSKRTLMDFRKYIKHTWAMLMGSSITIDYSNNYFIIANMKNSCMKLSNNTSFYWRLINNFWPRKLSLLLLFSPFCSGFRLILCIVVKLWAGMTELLTQMVANLYPWRNLCSSCSFVGLPARVTRNPSMGTSFWPSPRRMFYAHWILLCSARCCSTSLVS